MKRKITTKIKNFFQSKNIKTILSYYAFFLVINIVLLATLGLMTSGDWIIFLTWNVAFTTIFLIIASFFNRRWRKIFMGVIMLLTIVLAMVDVMYYYNYMSITSISSVVLLKGEAQGVASSIVDVLFKSHAMLFLIFIPLEIAILYFDKMDNFNNKKTTLNLLITAMALFGSSVFTFDRAEGNYDEFMSDWYLIDTLFDREDAFATFSMFGYHLADVVDYVGKTYFPPEYDTSSIDTYFDEKVNYNTTNEYTGVFEGKNLVLIQAESLVPEGVNETVTPTMSYMKENGIYFSNMYATVTLGETSDAEFASQTGLIPNMSAVTAYTNNQNEIPFTLANLFSEQAYYTTASHCNTGAFYSRSANFPTLYDFETYYAEEDLDIDEQFQGYWWNRDTTCLPAFYETIPESEQPFYMFWISVSAHNVYTDRKEYTDTSLTGETYEERVMSAPESSQWNDEMKAYMGLQGMLDDSIAMLVDQLKADGEYEDTVFIIYGDHKPIIDYGKYSDGESTYKDQQIPLIIYTPSMGEGNGKEIDTVGGTYSITPTIVNLFNLDPEQLYSKYYAGVDLFQDVDYPIFMAGGEVIYNGNEFTEAEINNILATYQYILETDYFKGKGE